MKKVRDVLSHRDQPPELSPLPAGAEFDATTRESPERSRLPFTHGRAIPPCGASDANRDDRPSPPERGPGDDDDAPETPLDEPAPMPVQDPPNEPDKHPYTVHGDI